VAVGTVRVTGLKEFTAAVKVAQGRTGVAELGNQLKEVAEPVAQGTRQKLGRYGGDPAGGVRVRRRGLNIAVEQSKRKVTGKRGDFGALQMRKAFVPSLEENRAQVVAGVEKWLDTAISTAGL